MRRSTNEIAVHQTSWATSTSKNRHWFDLFFCILLFYILSGIGHVSKYTNNCHCRKGITHMRSAQSSARVATVTVALFRRFNTASSFRFYSPYTARQGPALVGLVPQRYSSFQAYRASLKSVSYQSTRNKIFATRNLSTFEENQGEKQENHSFSVPAMGTDITNDDSLSVDDYTGYEKWVRRLYATNMFHPVKLGLDNMHLLHKLLGNPMDDPNRMVIHVAGTNGKGSVCLKIANALRNQQKQSETTSKNLNVGIFCSPHVSSFRERMQVNGEMITEEEVVELLPQIYDLCLPEKHDIPATFFEITTALAFLFFAKRKADVVVLETGLGGRLDATNVIANPALSIITSIGLEHTRILGDTIELIAKEKAGIIKKDCPVLVGRQCPHEVIMDCARQKSAGRYYTPSLVEGNLDDFAHTSKLINESESEGPVDYDQENQEIAKAALSLLETSHSHMFGKNLSTDEIDNFTSIRPPCRFETLQMSDSIVILDVAHNPSAMEYLVYKLKTTYPEASFRFVAGMSADKDLGQCARALLSATKGSSRNIHLVQAAHPRAASLESIINSESALDAVSFYDLEDRSITKQVLHALDLTKKDDNEILVVCGSVFLMAETREALGIDEPRDSEYITEMAGSGIRHGQENFGNTKI